MTILEEMAHMPILWNGPDADSAQALFIFSHGAGAPMDSPFMEYFAQQLAGHGIRVLRFEFPYMAQRRTTGIKRPPERMERLLTSWRQILAEVQGHERIFIGGKSMGGRMASLIAGEFPDQVKGLICLGYPFHPTGRLDKPRTAHLAELATPTLMVQGTRDTMGNKDTVAGYNLSSKINFHWAEEGNHDLVPRKRSGFTQQENWQAAVMAICEFMAVSG